MQSVTNGSFILFPMFKARKGGFKTISISVELFFSIFGGKSFDKYCLQGAERLNLRVQSLRGNNSTGKKESCDEMKDEETAERGSCFCRRFGTGKN